MNQREDYSLSEVITDFKSFLHYLAGKWLFLIITVLFGAALGFSYSYFQKPKYKAVTSFILEEKSAGGSGLAGLASQFGFNLGSLSGGESIFAGDNILNILRSKKVVREVLLTSIDSSSAPTKKTLADLYLDFTGTKKSWQRKPWLANINFALANQSLTPVEDSVLNVLYERIIKKNVTTDKKSKQGTIYQVEVNAENSDFARMLADRLVQEASRLYLDIRVGTAQKNIFNLQKRSDSLLRLLNSQSYTAAASQPLDMNPGFRTAAVPVEIATRDKTILATLYAEVTKNLEASKLLLSQQTPVIQLLDQPGYLLDNNEKGTTFLIVVFSFIACCLFIALNFIYYYFLRGKNS